METANDSTVTLRHVGSGSGAAGPAAPDALLAPNPCFDDANVAYEQESDTHRWYYNRASTDSSISATTAETAIRRGAYNITHPVQRLQPGMG